MLPRMNGTWRRTLRAVLPLSMCLLGFTRVDAATEQPKAALSWTPSAFKAAGTNVCTFVVGQVTDPVGDAVSAGTGVSTAPDLVSGSVTVSGSNLQIRVRFAPGTYNASNTFVTVALDTDQNVSTGLKGIDANTATDVSLIGADYLVTLGSSFDGNTAQVYRYNGTAGLLFSPVTGAPVQYSTDGIDVTLPLTTFGQTFTGQVSFKFVTYTLQLSGGFSQAVDVMPNVGTAAGSTSCPASGTGLPALQVFSGGIVSAASYGGGAVAPGEVITIFGSGLGGANLTGLSLTPAGNVSTQLANTQVLFDGVAAPIIYTQAGQLAVVVPYDVAGRTSTQIQVIYQGQTAATVPVSVVAAAPALFTSDSSGFGQAAVLNQDNSFNSSANPASRGSIVQLYGTGGGQLTPIGVNGQVTPSTAPLPMPQLPVSVTIGGQPATVLYAGGAPGLVSGILQLNVQIPATVPTGNLPVVVTIGGYASPANVTIAVK